ncbi:MAG: trypsin-like peptidase domain-containing protein [Chloroflexi bacterium]|nr:MAG: trypsin-like peptidase domain-containing protein [Chloroflexota bacterium]
MRSRNRVPRWLATLVVVVAVIGLIAVGYLAAVRGWVQIGRNNSPSPTPIALVDVIDRVQSSAVTIDATTLDGDFVGSGFVSASGGVVLTNAHVVEHSFRTVVVDREGNKYQGHTIGLDKLNDVAALKVTGFDPLPLTLAIGSVPLKAGTEIYVVGNPGGTHPNSVLKGVVSATGLSYTVQGVDYHNLYQLDTANVAPGNSGSPVITSDGKVVGMDALGDTRAASTRFAYAIPVSTFRQEAVDWAKAGSPIPVAPADLPWQTDPKQAVVQQRELRTGYTRSAEGPAQFSGSGASPPSDEVTFVLPGAGGNPSRRIFSRVIVYTNRADAGGELTFEHKQLIAAGAADEQQSAPLGEMSYLLTETSGDGTTAVSVIWRDRNVQCTLELDGLTGAAAAQTALALATAVEARVAASPTVNPDAP